MIANAVHHLMPGSVAEPRPAINRDHGELWTAGVPVDGGLRAHPQQAIREIPPGRYGRGERTMEPMENGHFLRNALLFVVGLVVVGMIAVWAIKALFGMVFYILVGALVVGGGIYLYGRAKRAIRGERRRPPINRW
jgi:hypothetical protein